MSIKLKIIILLAIVCSPFIILGQASYLLQEPELQGYRLKSQSTCSFIIGENDKLHPGIIQTWSKIGMDNSEDIYIKYCEFNNINNTIQGIAYGAINGYSKSYFWGSLTGFIIDDGSWINYNGSAMFFIRGNVGVHILKPINYNEKDKQQLIQISNIIKAKIEANLSSEILTFEQALKQKQIPMTNYQAITDPVIQSDLMNGYSIAATWDSKWLTDTDQVVMGIRTEWKNDSGSIIGIDIAKFESVDFAGRAAELMNTNTYFFNHKLSLNNLVNLENIFKEWQQYGNKNNISIVGIQENIALHIYQYDTTGINTNFISKLVTKLADQVINF